MHFLMPHVFASHREFKEWFSNPVTGMIQGNSEYNDNIIKRLHKVSYVTSLFGPFSMDLELVQLVYKFSFFVMLYFSSKVHHYYLNLRINI